MKLWCLLLPILNLLLTEKISGDVGSSITAESLIAEAGYPYEKHEVKTSDGYILGVHRIPYSARVNTSSPRPVVFIMHGLFAASSDWLILGRDYALPYLLSNSGYDVWLGNARGNRFSRKHATLDPDFKRFWHFDWHQIGTIDLPNMIDYIRNYTGVDKVRYFGHSQGGTTFLVASSLNKDFNSRIISAHLLAPAAFMEDLTIPFAGILAPILGQPQPFLELFGDFEIFPNTKMQEYYGNALCVDGSPIQFLCSFVFLFLGGNDPDNLNTTMLPKIFSIFPAGASVNQLYHYSQMVRSRRFRGFDFGTGLNQRLYGTAEPPDYPLKKISAPVFLYYGQRDSLISIKGIERLKGELSKSTLRGSYKIPFPKWNHFDYLYSTSAKMEIYDKIFEDIASIPQAFETTDFEKINKIDD